MSGGLDFYTIGARPVFGTHTFEPDEIIAFAKKYDPQPFHLDAELARDSMFGDPPPRCTMPTGRRPGSASCNRTNSSRRPWT